MTGDLDAAVADFSQAIKLQPGLADAYYRRATAVVAAIIGTWTGAVK